MPGSLQITEISATGATNQQNIGITPTFSLPLSSQALSATKACLANFPKGFRVHLPLSNFTVSALIGALLSPLLEHYKSKLIFTAVLSTFTQNLSNPGSLPTMDSTMRSLKALLFKVWCINYTLQQQVSPGSCLEMQNLTTKPEF